MTPEEKNNIIKSFRESLTDETLIDKFSNDIFLHATGFYYGSFEGYGYFSKYDPFVNIDNFNKFAEGKKKEEIADFLILKNLTTKYDRFTINFEKKSKNIYHFYGTDLETLIYVFYYIRYGELPPNHDSSYRYNQYLREDLDEKLLTPDGRKILVGNWFKFRDFQFEFKVSQNSKGGFEIKNISFFDAGYLSDELKSLENWINSWIKELKETFKYSEMV